MHDELRHYQDTNLQYQQEISKIQVDQNNLAQDFNQYYQRCAVLNATNNTLEQKLAALQSKMESYDAFAEEQTNLIHNLKSELTTLKSSNISLVQELSSAKKQSNELTQQTTHLRDNYDTLLAIVQHQTIALEQANVYPESISSKDHRQLQQESIHEADENNPIQAPPQDVADIVTMQASAIEQLVQIAGHLNLPPA